MKKYRFYRYPVKVGQLVCKNHLFFMQNGSELYQRVQVYSQSIFVKKRWLLKRNGDFEGGGEREPTNTATHPRIDGLGVGRVAVWRV